MSKTISIFQEELSILREKVNNEKSNANDVTERVRQALVLYSSECERILREREQELTIAHELELADAKKLIQARDDEIRTLKQTIIEKETEFSEQERLINSRLMHQKRENDQEEMRNLQARYQSQLNEALDQAQMEKEIAVKQARDVGLVEIAKLNSNLGQCREKICELEENLDKTRNEQEKIIKESVDKFEIEYRIQLDAIRSRFKLMTASTAMERSPSDSSLEKIERPDMIEIVNHEAILAQEKKNMEGEKREAIRKAIEEEKAGFDVKLYKLEDEKERIEKILTMERKILSQRESQIHELEIERNELRQELNDERMKMSQSNSPAGGLVDTLKTLLSGTKDDIDVSESKKVRLESSCDTETLTRRLEILEIDNIRLNSELRVARDDKDSMETLIEALEADKVRLEVELVRERSRRGFLTGGDSGIASSIESRDKDMITSVSVVTESLSQDCSGSGGGATSSELNQSQDANFRFHEKLIKSTTSLLQQLPISTHSCNPGDSVIVLWNTTYRNYIILQDSKTMYFLHPECIDTLNLRPNSDGFPKQTYVLGEVIDKQYCHAKKSNNRYYVPQGTKFYRVKIKLVQRDVDLTISITTEKNQS